MLNRKFFGDVFTGVILVFAVLYFSLLFSMLDPARPGWFESTILGVTERYQ